MIRKSIAYRRLWYVRKRNAGRIHVLLRLFAALLILASLFLLFSGGLLPRLRHAAELGIREAYVTALREATDRVFSGGAGYKDIVVFENAADGNISMISLDTARLDELTEELLYLTEAKLGLPDAGKVRISIADPESPFFRPGGILDFDVAVRQAARPVVDYIPEYIPINEGQTRLKVTLTADVSVSYRAELFEGNMEISAEMPATEFVILGKISEK
jgi:hypothetical protein